MTAGPLGDLCWYNGQIARLVDVRIDPSDRGFTLGDGLFETLLWTGQQIRFFEDHMARMGHGASQLGLVNPFDIAAIEKGLVELAAASIGQPAALRLTVTRGSAPRGLKIPEKTNPNILATIAKVPRDFPPVSVSIVDVWRSGGAPSSRFKTLSYVDNIVALAMAEANGADDGLMRGPDDSIACGTSSNVLIHQNGRWLTPPLDDGALPGIVRGRLVRAGLVLEGRILRSDIETCQAACLTNSISGIRPIRAINGRALDLSPQVFADLAAILA